MGCHFLLQGIFAPLLPHQGLNLGLLHCRQILYQLSHQGSPYINTGRYYCASSNEHFYDIGVIATPFPTPTSQKGLLKIKRGLVIKQELAWSHHQGLDEDLVNLELRILTIRLCGSSTTGRTEWNHYAVLIDLITLL